VRLVYLGTPDVAVPPLRAIVAAGHDVRLVATRVDRRRGRGGALSPSPVKVAAVELGLPVSHDVDDVLSTGAELGVVVAFGRIIKPHILAALPMINVHFSLLPRWRGAAPVERALLAGDEVTGVCVMAVDETLDTGAVYARREVPIRPGETAAELRAELVSVGTELLVSVLSGPLPEPVAQVGTPTYADKIDPAELRIDWGQPAEQIDRWIRVGGVWTMFRGKRLKVHAGEVAAEAGEPGEPGVLIAGTGTVATGGGSLRLLTVQPEGRPPMTWRDFANGTHPVAGERLG
jgi:methionyl-tRNA formyltransferase